MKKIFALALMVAAGVMAASAQYFSTKEYQNFHYTAGDKSFETTVVNVDKAENGDIDVFMEMFLQAPEFESMGGKITLPAYGHYNAETGASTYTLMSEGYMKSMIIAGIMQQLASAGYAGDEAKLQEVKSQIDSALVVKGQIDIVINPNANVGDKIPDSSMTFGIGPMTNSMNLWNGKFLGFETITVPAGTFECVKIEYVIRTKTSAGIEKKHTTDWYAKGIGPVRSVAINEETGEESVDELQSID